MKKTSCRICKTEITPFISFGSQPLANGFLTSNDFPQEYFFELAACFCPKCTMVQLLDQPEPEKMFNENYAFFSGTSQHMTRHFKAFAEEIRETVGKDVGKPFIVELGSNDGILLKNFAEAGIHHLGVEPSANVAEVARRAGVQTQVGFFNVSTAEAIVRQQGPADAVLAANVLCHIADIHSVLEGVQVLLKPSGTVCFEDPYIGDVLRKTSYDQIYDEHVFLFSLSSVRTAFGLHGFELFDAVPQPTHGGSMRYYLARKGTRKETPRLTDLLKQEESAGTSNPQTYANFKTQCEASRKALRALLQTVRSTGKRVVGYAATSKSTTVTNYCGLTPDLIEFISDTTPLKQGKFSPGVHIPVRPYQEFSQKYPDYALLFGWNHRAEIVAKEQAFLQHGGQWISYVPQVEVLSSL